MTSSKVFVLTRVLSVIYTMREKVSRKKGEEGKNKKRMSGERSRASVSEVYVQERTLDISGFDLAAHGLSVMVPTSDDKTAGVRTLCGRSFIHLGP